MRPRTQRRRHDPKTQRQLIARGGALAALAQHPSWGELEAEVGRKEERLRKVLLAQVLGNAPVSQRNIDYVRGFIGGMNWLIAQPSSAENTLEAYLREQGVEMEGVAEE